MINQPRRRRVDQKSREQTLADMTPEQRQELRLVILSREICEACDRWLAARGVRETNFMPKYNPPTTQSPPEPSSTQHGGTSETANDEPGVKP